MSNEPESWDAYRPGYERTAEQILELIASKGLRSGDHLGTETQLADQLHVSRTVAREAVKTLTALGRVRPRKGKGLYVADQGSFTMGVDFFLPAKVEHVLMLFEFRMLQEESAARLAALRATPPQLRAVREAAEQTRTTAKAGDLQQFQNWDDTFHKSVAEASNNHFLTSAVTLARSLQREAKMLGLRNTMPGPYDQAAEEHLRIYEAIAGGDPDGAAHAARDHLEQTRQQYQSRIEEFMRIEDVPQVSDSKVAEA